MIKKNLSFKINTEVYIYKFLKKSQKQNPPSNTPIHIHSLKSETVIFLCNYRHIHMYILYMLKHLAF